MTHIPGAYHGSGLNYILTIGTVTVTPGQTISTTVSSPYKLGGDISPTNSSTHEVSWDYFSISGATGTLTTSVIASGNNAGITKSKNTFNAGDTGVILPDGVTSVAFEGYTNYLGINNVTLEIILDPDFVVPINASSPFEIVLDIDGDAQPIGDTQVVATGAPANFDLTVELDSNSNCQVFAFRPGDVAMFNLLNTASWQWDLASTSVNVEPYTSATFTWKPGIQTVTSSPIFGSAAINGDNSTSHAWFYIIPNPGFTLSRHNLSIQPTTSSSNIYNLPGVANDTASEPSTENSSVTLTSQVGYNYNVSSLLSTGSYGISQAYHQQNIQSGIIQNLNGTFAYTGYINRNVISTSNATLVSTNINYNDIVNGSTITPYGTHQILLVDTGGASDLFPFNIDATGFSSGTQPSNLATGDFNGNGVLVILNGFYNYVPGNDPANLKIQINGSAMVDDGLTSQEFNFNIDDE